jgi:sugar lactone lactonase YvrE
MLRPRLPSLAILIGALCATLLSACDTSAPDYPAGVRHVFGRTGQGPGEFSYPRAAVLGLDGRLYIVDKAARIHCYTPDGEFLFDWRMPAWDAGMPTGLGIGPDGRVYAADTHYSRVVVFEADGRYVAEFGTRGTGPGQFLMPTDVAVDPQGRVYVGEYGGNDRISRFSPQFEYQYSFGGPDAGPARLRRPQGLLLDRDGTLWVADSCNHRICHFAAEGTLLATFGHSGSGPGELRFPYGLDWLADGTLVVAEYGGNRVQRFARDGRSLGTWGAAGRRPGQLAYPWAVTVGADSDLFVLDSGNNRVQVVGGRERDIWRPPPRTLARR